MAGINQTQCSGRFSQATPLRGNRPLPGFIARALKRGTAANERKI
jgi:hypothetical protein